MVVQKATITRLEQQGAIIKKSLIQPQPKYEKRKAKNKIIWFGFHCW